MPTIRDVARRAGVAPSTVSYALSGKRPISEDARARIAQAIAELDFTPSSLGRQLAHSRSNMIGLIFPVPESELEWETLDFVPSAADALAKHGYGLSVFTGPLTPQKILNLYRENTVDGLIVMQITHEDARIESIRDAGYPLVLVGRCANSTGLTLVDFAPEDGIYLIVEHLVKLGHTRIGYLDMPHIKHRQQLGYARFVQMGFERACAVFGIMPSVEIIDDSSDAGFHAAMRLLRREPDLSAIISAHGNAPSGALRAAKLLGRRVPEDCSISGLVRPLWAHWSNPQLTSADVPLNAMVRSACELILRQLDGDRTPRQVIFPAQLIERETTAAYQPAPTALATG